MRNAPAALPEDHDLPKGIQRSRPLPDPKLGALWESIILDEQLKSQLLSQAMLNFTLRGKVDRSVIPLHGVILLVGPPGTGKTSLARGLAHRTAESFKGGKFRLLEVEPHALDQLGYGQDPTRRIGSVFAVDRGSGRGGPTIVLLDEVETLAADRSKMSLEANPIDIHRATDAVLVQLDTLAEQYPNLLVHRDQQLPAGGRQRVHVALRPGHADPAARRRGLRRILKDCLTGLGRTYPAIGKLVDVAAIRPLCARVRRP